MSLRKWCGPSFETTHPLHCADSPDCDHHWFYDFRVNRHRYRATTETANKQEAKKIEARERSRILEAKHGIRKQPDITFRAFADTYVTTHAELHKRSVDRDREIIAVLNRAFGSLILHELTAMRIEQFKRERLTGKWRGHLHKGPLKPIQPGTVNRELDTLKSILAKAVEWKKLLDSPARGIARLKVDNRRTRILTEDEQRDLIAACPKNLRLVVRLALVTGARIGELLALRWDDIGAAEFVFLETKNGRARRIPIGPSVRAILAGLVRGPSGYVFTNRRTHDAYTVNGVAHVFRRALQRALITTGDVTLHTLRHTALSRMIAAGIDDHTVMAISGHSSTRMLERYTHPTDSRKLDALETFAEVDGPKEGRTEKVA